MKRIALIDDDKIYQKFLEKELVQFYPEYFIDVFENGETAVDAIKDDTLIVVCDYELGAGINGVEVLQKIKENYPDIEVIMLSGTYNDKRESECYRNDAIGFIHKDRKFAKVGFFSLKKTMDLIVFTDKKISKLEERVTKLEAGIKSTTIRKKR